MFALWYQAPCRLVPSPQLLLTQLRSACHAVSLSVVGYGSSPQFVSEGHAYIVLASVEFSFAPRVLCRFDIHVTIFLSSVNAQEFADFETILTTTITWRPFG
jgi:hypothetical protein